MYDLRLVNINILKDSLASTEISQHKYTHGFYSCDRRIFILISTVCTFQGISIVYGRKFYSGPRFGPRVKKNFDLQCWTFKFLQCIAYGDDPLPLPEVLAVT